MTKREEYGRLILKTQQEWMIEHHSDPPTADFAWEKLGESDQELLCRLGEAVSEAVLLDVVTRQTERDVGIKIAPPRPAIKGPLLNRRATPEEIDKYLAQRSAVDGQPVREPPRRKPAARHALESLTAIKNVLDQA